MKKSLVPFERSSGRMSACTLAFVSALGCGVAPDEVPSVAAGDVGAARQAVYEPYDAPQDLGDIPAARSCDADERRELLSTTRGDMELDCSITLAPNESVSKRILFRGNSRGVILDCQDQLRARDSKGRLVVPSIGKKGQDDEMIGIRSSGISEEKDENGFYGGERPEGIVIKNCTIHGQVRIAGVTSRDMKNRSSHDMSAPRHVARMRAVAPTNILFQSVTLVAEGSTPLYVHDGVTRFTMIDSVVDGKAGKKPGIYFDQETAENTILNSRLSVANEREQLAIDASSYNFFVGNTVSGLDDGGLHLYRNCGEHGTVRYSTPSFNVIVGNHFNYNKYRHHWWNFNRHSVHLSSRNGTYNPYNPLGGYCGDDRYGNVDTSIETSYTTPLDNAHDNIVTNNELLNRSPKAYIQNSSRGNYNFNTANREVSRFSNTGKACYSPLSFGRVLLHKNKEVVPLEVVDGIPTVCGEFSCDDGKLAISPSHVPCPEPGSPISVDCRAENDNNGCQNLLSCPVGQKVKQVRAACNLEYGAVTDTQLETVPWNVVRVVSESDNYKDGKCSVIDTDAVRLGDSALSPNKDIRTVHVACREKDSTGGDCHVRAQFTCE